MRVVDIRESPLSAGDLAKVTLERQQHLVKELLTRAVLHIEISGQLRPARQTKFDGAPKAVLNGAIRISEEDVCSYEVA